jgi:hypothetical protein
MLDHIIAGLRIQHDRYALSRAVRNVLHWIMLKVAVSLCRGGFPVAQYLANDIQRAARSHSLRGECVPEIVQATIRQPSQGAEAIPGLMGLCCNRYRAWLATRMPGDCQGEHFRGIR